MLTASLAKNATVPAATHAQRYIGFALLAVLSVLVQAFSQERPTMTPEEWKASQSRDRVKEAMQILDDPNWPDGDPWIRYFREEEKHPERTTPGHVKNAIDRRETEALGIVVTSTLSDEQKERLFEKYLRHRNRNVALGSLGELVRRGVWSAERAMDFAEKEWGETNPIALLHSVLNSPKPEAGLAVARRWMLAILNAPEGIQSPGLGSWDYEALRLLVASRDPGDHALIHRAILRYPEEDPLLWLVVSRVPLTKEVRAKAEEVYRDTNHSLSLRCAAAVVLAQNEKEAEDFTVGHIRAFLDEFAGQDLPRRMLAALGGTPVEQIEGAEAYPRYKEHQLLVDMLFLLPSETARKLTFEYLRADDYKIRRTLGYIAVIRWPEQFLDVERETFPDDEAGEFDRLLAALVWHHPHLRDRAVGKSTAEKMETELTRMRESGPAAVCGKSGFPFYELPVDGPIIDRRFGRSGDE